MAKVYRADRVGSLLRPAELLEADAPTAPGNMLTPDERKRKLELVVDTACEVWR